MLVNNYETLQELTVGVVIPAKNEEKNLQSLLAELTNLGYDDILVIDGNSTDKTVNVAKSFGAKVMRQNGHGKGGAIKEVFSNCNLDFDIIVMLDADCSMDPKEIPLYLEALKSGADVVKGSRFLRGGYTHDMSVIRMFGNLVMMSVVNLLHNTNYTDLCYGFMAFNRCSRKKLAHTLRAQYFDIEAEIFIKSKKLGLTVVEVPSTEYERKNGDSNLCTFRDGFKIFRRIISELVG